MRVRHVATTLAAVTAGLTAAAAVRHRTDRRATGSATATVIAAPAVPERDAVVLQFVRPAAPVVEQPVRPARCGDNGGRTKTGAPCAARATTDGRCHHHVAA